MHTYLHKASQPGSVIKKRELQKHIYIIYSVLHKNSHLFIALTLLAVIGKHLNSVAITPTATIYRC
ncbi:hypothetical protein SAMN05216464_103366 [Mucilaginibacter pineti]|uniref:Uncharacterized protein n=1 Tax=Mucilaginibacter pineti TaxID=1391627 RepID=A0A1G6ZIA3_9SPHI|nr:hypothetical protein SAMN05216464_103366 [Mucilaginibacter pineti]